MYLLIPIPPIYNIIPLSYLHSTMYLLIPAISLFRKCFGHLFTFHYVSINSLLLTRTAKPQTLCFYNYVSINSLLLTHDYYEIIKFTFHYVSINSNCHIYMYDLSAYLHSTMYLLILTPFTTGITFERIFTFHYVSINSCPAM